MTYAPPVVVAPAVLPWDLPAIVADALDVLRLDPSDEDADRIATAATTATALLEQRLDLETSPWMSSAELPAPLTTAATNLTVELYRRKDAPFGVTDAWSVDGALVRLSSDVLRGVGALVAPYRGRRAVG